MFFAPYHINLSVLLLKYLTVVNRGLKTSQKQDLKIGHRKVRAN